MQGYVRIRHFIFADLIALALVVAVTPARAATWLPVSPEDLQMQGEPKAPSVAAIYLYRQVDRDDDAATEAVHTRIKVLTEEGRKYGDVEIPYEKGSESIRGLEARTIRPDGTVIEFDGIVYDKPLVKARNFKMMAKTFTLPKVEVGSIVEYRYRRSLAYGWIFNSRWILSQDLFTRHAVFSLTPSSSFTLRWSWPLGLPDNTRLPNSERGMIRLETRDVPAFVSEEYMPPENLMKYRVEFVYEDEHSDQREQKSYWAAFGKRMHRNLERFVSDRRAMERAVAEIVQPGDSDAAKVRKLYARAQQIRNLSFERRKTEQEAKREQLAEIDSAAEVWTRGYGNGVQINWLFLALARAANIEAYAVLVPTRDDYFFDPKLMNARQLNSNVVVVKLDGREIYLDPGTPFTPFGLLPWSETGVVALRLDKHGGAWVNTPLPRPADSRVERKASVKLTASRSLEGKLAVTYTGLEASRRRLSQRHEDDTDRAEALEKEVKADVPLGVEVKLTNKPDWSGTETPLVAEFDFKAPGYAAAAGKRALLTVGLFGAGEKHTFKHAARVHPIYFMFPYQHSDEVAIQLPEDWQVSSVPKARSADINVMKYSMTSQAKDGSLILKRELSSNTMLVQTKHYGHLRDFYQTVRAGDEDQAVVAFDAAPVAVSSTR